MIITIIIMIMIMRMIMIIIMILIIRRTNGATACQILSNLSLLAS